MRSEKQNRINHGIIMLLASFILLTGFPSGGEASNSLYHDYLRQAEHELGFSGAVLVMEEDSILLAEGYGPADRERSVPNTNNTKFLLCSVTKQFTAAAIMQLAERGLLDLDEPVTRYLPDYASSSVDKITVYHLLTQTSGIADYLSLVDSNETFSRFTPTEKVVSMFMGAPLEFEAGSRWEYSNSNYYLLGKIIETVSGMAYGEFVERNILEPLEMKNSGFPVQYLTDLPKAAKGYKTGGAGMMVAAQAVHSSWPFAAGGLYSTVIDMAKWEKALRNGTVLSRESIAKMQTPFKWRYGCGWEIDTLYGHPVASHGGMGGGYCSITIRFIDLPFCVAVLSNNGSDFKRASKIAYDLVAVRFDKLQVENDELQAEKSDQALEYVDPLVLAEYAGDYELAPGVMISFRCRDGRLFTQGPGQPEFEIFPRSEEEFFLKVVEGTVWFVRDSTGKVSSIRITQGGRTISADKI